MDKLHRKAIIADAVLTYGISAQEDMCIEEMSELTKALLKLRREDSISRNSATGSALISSILEEIADVQITLDQMRLIYGDTAEQEEFKLNRLKERLGGDTP